VATCTHRAVINTTTNASSYASGSFTPAQDDLLVVAFSPGALLGTSPGVTGSANGITFVEVTAAAAVRASVDDVRLFVAQQLVPASPASMTVTASPGGSASGMNGWVVSVAGLTRTGLAAVRGAAGANNASGVTPTVTMAQAALTGNPVLAFAWNATNTSGLTLPASFTSGSADVGYATPTRGGRYGFRNSGHTSDTVTWGATSATASANIATELDTSAAPTAGLTIIRRPLNGLIGR
jgi:hypothetical protein